MTLRVTTIALAATMVAGAPALAQQDFEAEVKARQGQYRLNAVNIGTLAAMAKGELDYDADLAQAAADNLVTISQIRQVVLWPSGSDSESIDGTRALPAIWENTDDFLAKWEDFGTAAAQMQEVAADGRAALGPALGALGDSCKACHEEYREER